jgi:hypothetical protein
LPHAIYATFLHGYKPRTSLWADKQFKMLLEQVFPECNDLDSYKLKKRYYKSAQIDLLPAMSVMGQEGTVLDYVWVVVGGKVDVLR